MKTTLHFEAPGDLSVGTVRITGEGETIADWVATPDNRIFRQDDLKSGIYSAEISPAGVSPQSVVFQVEEGRVNSVVLPSFTALSSSGSKTSFFDSTSQQTVAEVPPSMNQQLQSMWRIFDADESETASRSRESDLVSEHLSNVAPDISRKKIRLSIGLSEEKNGRETFGLFSGQSRMALFPGRLEIEIPADPLRNPWAGQRVRLSASSEGVRIERCLLPLYQGGTKIVLVAPPFSAADIELSILPVDPRLRALIRTLDAGTSADATAVRDDIPGLSDRWTLLRDDADPWRAMLVGLLAIRFPDIFQSIDLAWADALVERASWAFEAHVIRASLTLSTASNASTASLEKTVEQAITYLAQAQVAGSPYFRYTNQLFAEMALGISDYLAKSSSGKISPAVKRFYRLYNRWHRELPLQRGAGPTFTWLARDQAALKEHHLLVPHRNPSGRLRTQDTLVIFEGRVSAGQIEIIGKDNSPAHPPEDYDKVTSSSWFSVGPDDAIDLPAFRRPPGPDDDPNKGRFGGEARQGGFRIAAAFSASKRQNWVNVALIVEADSAERVALGDFAWFVLHPTFSPSIMKVAFRGRRAQLRLQVWGGFTVGVWLPKTGDELEIDLASIPDAPKIVKER
ncbi:pYEATS domain-containing protein [Pseudocitrobacter cyperus]|uniref:PYEATS domain-containing protein n=1 Tax=Pseudocitrobacter cyperus TaxID=3112843 RepID=A0ABV0HL08_9ENTR